VLISETAIAPAAGKAAKIPGLFAGANAAGMVGLVWFDLPGNRDWPLEDDQAALAAFRAAVALYRNPPAPPTPSGSTPPTPTPTGAGATPPTAPPTPPTPLPTGTGSTPPTTPPTGADSTPPTTPPTGVGPSPTGPASYRRGAYPRGHLLGADTRTGCYSSSRTMSANDLGNFALPGGKARVARANAPRNAEFPR
jgi:hypothetical protein